MTRTFLLPMLILVIVAMNTATPLPAVELTIVRGRHDNQQNGGNRDDHQNEHLDDFEYNTNVSPACRCQDDLWIISTRRLHCPCHELTPSRFQVARWVDHRWVRSNMAEYVASQQQNIATVVYIHGNRMNIQRAVSRGLTLYRNSIHVCKTPQRLRYVIWSWPSEKESGGPVQDVRSKAQRTDLECGYLSWFLSQVPQHSTVSLIGYSYGSRIVTGALQSLHQTAPDEGPTIRAALLAAAVHASWLKCDGPHGQALLRASQVLLMYNPRDPALKLYHVVDPRCDPRALGFRGFPGCVASLPNLHQMDVSRIVGRSHYEMRYYRSTVISRQLRSFLLCDTVPSAPEIEEAPVDLADGRSRHALAEP